MEMKTIYVAMALLMTTMSLFAQKSKPSTWTLSDCIEYALENNITIKQSQVSYEKSLVNNKTAQAAYYPDLSFSAGYNLNNQPYGTSDNTTLSGQYGLNSSWTVFNGKRKNNITLSNLNSDVSELGVTQTQNSIIESILQLYIQMLYAKETIKTNESTLEVSKAQCERAEAMLNIGSIAKTDYLQLQAEYSKDNYQLVTSKASFDNYKLQLRELLELTTNDTFEIVIPEYNDDSLLIILPTNVVVLQKAMDSRPEIKSSLKSIDISNLNVDIAKAGYYPNISLSAGTGIGHNTSYDNPFGEQLKNSWDNTLSVNLSIPILDNRQIKSNIELAKLETTNSQLNHLDQVKTLRKTIESLLLDANSSQEQYRSAIENLKYAKESYYQIQEQFNVGMKNTTDLLSGKNNYLTAQQQVLQAKYMTIYDIKLIRFYQGESIY